MGVLWLEVLSGNVFDRFTVGVLNLKRHSRLRHSFRKSPVLACSNSKSTFAIHDESSCNKEAQKEMLLPNPTRNRGD